MTTNFPDDTPLAGPAETDLLLYADVSDSNNAKSATFLEAWALLNKRTQAEQDAGVQAYTVVNGMGNIMFPQYPAGDARRYGVRPGVDCRAGIQAAINVLSHAGEAGSGETEAILPSGVLEVGGKLLGHYHGADNPGFNQSAAAGRFTLRGAGSRSQSDAYAGNDAEVGTVLQFTHSDDDGFVVGTASDAAKQFHLMGFSIDISSAGKAGLRLVRPAQGWSVENVTVNNRSLATPYGIVNEGGWGGRFDNVWAVGPRENTGGRVETDGFGYHYDPRLGGGGNTQFHNVNCHGWFAGVVGGNEFDPTLASFGNTMTFYNCQGNYNVINLWLRHGAFNVDLIDSFTEFAGAGGAALHHSIKVSDSAGYNTKPGVPDGPGRVGKIQVFGGSYGSSEAGHQVFCLGDDTGTIGRDRHGIVVINRPVIGFAGSGTLPDCVFRCHNTPGNGMVHVIEPSFSGNPQSPLFLIDADEAQYGPIVYDEGAGAWRYDDSDLCRTLANEVIHNKRFGQLPQPRRAVLTAGTVDYSDAHSMPPVLGVSLDSGETLTVNVPSNYRWGYASSTDFIRTGSGTATIELVFAGPPEWSATTVYHDRARVKVAADGKTYYLKSGGGVAAVDAPVDGVAGSTDGMVWIQENGDENLNFQGGVQTIAFSIGESTVRATQIQEKTWIGRVINS